jgi:hypothetical protein
MPSRRLICWRTFCFCALLSISQLRAETLQEGIEFFEKRIRPVLAQDCYECHRTDLSEKGGLALDHRAGVLKGGRSGKVIVPGDPDASMLIKALRHEGDLKMPKAGARLEPAIIADFEKWIRMGAPDPRDQPAPDSEVAVDTDWDAQLKRRSSWWSFQPISKPELPNQSSLAAINHPIDRFVRAKLQDVGLPHADRADQRTLLRRLSFVLRGLPPTPEEFAAGGEDAAGLDKIVDSFLGTSAFGEQWARHWMDWVRYADSHGSEGDPAIPYSWQYRDYLIRALNQDVPFDQLLREHLAGDLLPNPRINHELGLNESALGIGQYRMLLHGFAPTDPLDERVRNIDDQIDVLSKAFLGLTVSCARCHNHKFDAISQKDFYAMYGVLSATTPASIGVEVQSAQVRERRAELISQKERIKQSLSEAWISQADNIVGKLQEPSEKLRSAITAATDPRSILNLLSLVQKHSGNVDLSITHWRKQFESASSNSASVVRRWDFQEETSRAEWGKDGAAEFSAPGAFSIAREGDQVIESILPAGVFSHLATSKDRAVILSPKVKLDRDFDLWMRVAGDGGAVARYVIQNYPRDGSIYPVTRLNGGEWNWVKHPLNYWTGDRMHVELSTSADQAVLADTGSTHSWFGIREVVITERDTARPHDRANANEPLLAVLHGSEPATLAMVENGYATALRQSLAAWRRGSMNDGQASFLNQAIQLGLVDNSLAASPSVKPLVLVYRELKKSLPAPVRAPGLIETAVEDQPLLIRGNHKLPGEVVPRRFLEVLDSRPYTTSHSGRAELAEDFLNAGSRFTSRVIVNRVWHHLFGRGIVSTPDNFGRLGDTPSHPELLDYLAAWFVDNGYSLKKLIRFIVSSETWQASSLATGAALEKDPENKFLSHANLRRLEAESIRDSLLAVSGSLVEEKYGPPVLGTTKRRSVYVRVKRNDLDRFLTAFDAPVPSGAKGRRDVTNVPGQSLALLNDPFVLELAESWSRQIESGSEDDTQRIHQMFNRALGRRARPGEIESSRHLLEATARQQHEISAERQMLTADLSQKVDRTAALKAIGEQRLRSNRSEGMRKQPLAQPVAAWDFRKGTNDQVGTLHGKLLGNARVEAGALVLDGKGSYLATPATTFKLHAKTLEAWVQLDNLDQQGGGVVTVQDLDGEVFDSIVFAEKSPRQWVGGSDFFKRSRELSGTPESVADKEPVHIAISYAHDGTTTLYRNGLQYGEPYKISSPVSFAAGESQILLGNRHGSPRENRALKGKIFRARVYDRALTPEEIHALANDIGDLVSERDILAALTSAERQEYATLEAQCALIKERLTKIDAEKGLSTPWANLAHAMFNLKEFIYLQ